MKTAYRFRIRTAALLLALGTLLVPVGLTLYAPAASADSVPAPAQVPGGDVGDPAFEARLKKLETDLRCLVCQNQTLADSNAGLAEDLRREIRAQAKAGKSDEEIKQYLHDRYGDFVFYKPPVKPVTWALWFGPFALLFLGAFWLMHQIRSDSRNPAPDVSAAERAQAAAILDGQALAPALLTAAAGTGSGTGSGTQSASKSSKGQSPAPSGGRAGTASKPKPGKKKRV